MGADIPTASTTVEGGLHAHHWELFSPQQKTVSLRRFEYQSKLAVMTLNFHYIHRGGLPSFCQQDARLLDLLDAARHRCLDQHGAHGEGARRLETQFRAFLQKADPC
jgi:hypothetical protein